MNQYDLPARLRAEADDTRSEEREKLLRDAADFIDQLIQENRKLLERAG
jgi:hypothetical protein